MTDETSMDLNIQVKEFEKLKKEAQKKFNEQYTNDEQDSVYMFDDLWLDYSEEIVEGNMLKISGSMKTQENKNIGFFNMKVPLDFDKLIEIFQSYIKKLKNGTSIPNDRETTNTKSPSSNTGHSGQQS